MDSNTKKQAERDLAALGVRLVVLYGSRATGTAREDSDFDVAVLTESRPEESFLSQYGSTLEVLSCLLGVPEEGIDMAELRHANPLLLKQVTEKGRLLYGTEGDFLALKLKGFHRYVDYAPYFALERRVNRTAYVH